MQKKKKAAVNLKIHLSYLCLQEDTSSACILGSIVVLKGILKEANPWQCALDTSLAESDDCSCCRTGSTFRTMNSTILHACKHLPFTGLNLLCTVKQTVVDFCDTEWWGRATYINNAVHINVVFCTYKMHGIWDLLHKVSACSLQALCGQLIRFPIIPYGILRYIYSAIDHLHTSLNLCGI